MEKKVRVRFAPSPTGGLHLGGMRTVLYNYLFAKQNKGDFILRIEDTDQSRFVTGAERYIFDCLKWAGLEPDESPIHRGNYGPYRQSERKEIYRKYAEQLVADGFAYYAFDTPEELEKMRQDFKTGKNPSPQYDHELRNKMKNSLTLGEDEVRRFISEEIPYVIRIKMPEKELVSFNDMIRGEIHFDTSLVDDKVLLKADGMPTYHLAVVVDDYLMKITHAFRGEEWLSSAPVHILLWKYLGWKKEMPQWAHLPLILGPNGKLSKRDGAQFGFPVFAMNWNDPKNGEMTEGFKEKGFLPEAFINFLALLGWNDGTEQEIFTKEELIQRFSMERVHSGGAKFDYEKAKWFNHEWIKRKESQDLKPAVRNILVEKSIAEIDDQLLDKVISLVKDRCTLLTDFYDQSVFFFRTPDQYDLTSVQPKWGESKKLFFSEIIRNYELNTDWSATVLETNFKEIAAANKIKPGEVLSTFRIMLVGGKFGPGVFDIAAILGKDNTIQRIKKALTIF
ncbi:MAG: glutamate--tRNA ligase [Bacteroidetes bacterium]|nr:glutamate--tRNA ligase [Bacteroidota bacterium]MBS1931046.1 glutamate--tRNA ligase [Bacteroidota bacterium]